MLVYGLFLGNLSCFVGRVSVVFYGLADRLTINKVISIIISIDFYGSVII